MWYTSVEEHVTSNAVISDPDSCSFPLPITCSASCLAAGTTVHGNRWEPSLICQFEVYLHHSHACVHNYTRLGC